ncbi:hypothetical protein DFH08DRAFT_823098 [Mycena albidolilacea]|uniref:Uncharacterized protein n=1 Tax=Mycena albidolilacea TaxID=1033008 RepID=A0AAD7EBP6_9AGAR|nr:hypothetical protein DFH08DRAFT_823098 [Mycena albidolilacea]
MEPMDSPSERKKHPKTQVSPSRTPAARRLACAKYRQKKSEAIARKGRISMARLREETKSDPSAAKLRAEFAQEARAQYEERNRVHRAWKKRFRRLEASYRSEGSRKKNCTPVDYEVEWALYQQMKEDEKRGRVAEALAAPPAYTTGAPSTPSRHQAAPSTPSTPSLCQASPIPMIGHGRAIVHSDLTSALAQFTAMSSRGPAELLTTEDAQQATHFASGFPRAEAALISQAERASDMWLGHDPPDWTHLSDMARRRRRDHLLLELREVLRILDGLAEDSDAEEFQDGRLVYEVESDGDD